MNLAVRRGFTGTFRRLWQSVRRESLAHFKVSGEVMNFRKAFGVVAVAGMVAGSGLGMVATANAADTTNYIINCAGKKVTKPASIVITCADANVSINKIKWSSWDLNTAKGTGVLSWNTCLPKTCVAGVTVKYPVTITMGGVASAPNLNVFSKVDVAFPKGGPAATETGSYTLDNTLA